MHLGSLPLYLVYCVQFVIFFLVFSFYSFVTQVWYTKHLHSRLQFMLILYLLLMIVCICKYYKLKTVENKQIN